MFKVIILVRVPDLTLEEYDFLLTQIAPEKQERIKQHQLFLDAQNSLIGDILARIEICRATGLSNKQLEFATNSYGKPHLINNPQIHHNISHAGHYIACAIADNPVGIDIELIKPINIEIAKRFFSTNETSYILSVLGNIRMHRFFEIWTKKESQIKLEGKGLSKPLASFSVLDKPIHPEVFYHQVYSNKKTICYVSSSKKEPPHIRIIDTHTLLQQMNYKTHNKRKTQSTTPKVSLNSNKQSKE
ncbi:MAG: 4'-phosphopantetheinyl transferase superfamily protein [Nitrososphaerota archaeon]|jgi:4'-phosphopantetheinyl transferase|nr:4'-phosphopantetheinyl transferase superfamily protein [Nitrososphaerota archaeon]